MAPSRSTGGKALWLSCILVATAAWGCTAILGIDEDYQPADGPGVGGGSSTGSGGGGGSGGGTGGAVPCGNSVIDPGETCDDGNAAPGDGCDGDCQVECVVPADLGGDALEDPTTHHCYIYVHDDGHHDKQDQPWYDARYRCLANGYELAALTTLEEFELITDFTNSSGWTGATDQAVEGSFAWSNGEPWVFELWSPGEPDNSTGSEDCADIAAAGLRDDACELSQEYVCERHPPGPCGDGVVDAAEECDDGNTNPGDGCANCLVECEELLDPGLKFKDPKSHHCYLYGDNSTDWQAAETACGTAGFHLATMSSTEELKFINQQPDILSSWIGATDQAAEGEWRWSSGEPWEFIPWVNDPGNGDAQDCLRFLFDDLVAADCAQQYPYLCERDPIGKRSPLAP